jgi:RNA polymerase sigma-70 factor, ECF subfamily
MKHSRPSNAPSDMEPRPTANPDLDASPLRGGAGSVHVFVVSMYEAHHAEVFAFLVRASRDRSVAEELLRETYLRLTQEAREGRAPADPRTWLFRVATNLVIASARRQTMAIRWLGRFGRREIDLASAPTPETGVISQERAAEMERVLGGLSTDARLALLLSGAGFSGEGIAAALGRTAEATRTVLSRARARVRIRRDLFAEGPR